MLPDDELVETRADFIRFVYDLAADYRERGQEWENPRLDLFLEALGTWSEASDQDFKNFGQKPPENVNWKFFAQMLTAATMYE